MAGRDQLRIHLERVGAQALLRGLMVGGGAGLSCRHAVAPDLRLARCPQPLIEPRRDIVIGAIAGFIEPPA